jgi:hypothetical protein
MISTVPQTRRPWPPLITRTDIPRWIRIRDVLLTVMAWILLGWILRDVLYLAYDYLRAPLFILTGRHPDIGQRLNRLHIFAAMSLALIACLCLMALIRRRRLRAMTYSPQPPPLTVAEQAAWAGMEESAVVHARGLKIAVVQADGTIFGKEAAN